VFMAGWELWLSHAELVPGPRGGDPSGVWIWHRAWAWCSPRGREPDGVEQWLWRPTGWRLGKLAVLLLDCGVEKLFMIYGFRVLYFWLSLVLNLIKCVSSISAESLVQELMRSAALFQSPSWIPTWWNLMKKKKT
jgi:hypothetical protein